MKRYIFGLLALVIAIAGTGLSVAPAAAYGGACGFGTDNPGTTYYNNDYRSASGNSYYDNYSGSSSHLNVDIQSWRYTSTPGDGFYPTGHCFRQVRYSVWTDNGDYGNLWMHFRMWANSGGSCSQLVEDVWPTGVWAGSQAYYSPWWDYSGCGGPQADGWGFGSNPDWVPYYPNSVPAPYINL